MEVKIGHELRPCMVLVNGKEKKALFHCWGSRIGVGTVGVVEFEDGNVVEADPWTMRFLEKRVKDYDFGDIQVCGEVN